ncbi:MAG: DNA mismatch repair endonuclease MutL, partial [Salinibacter sp.]
MADESTATEGIIEVMSDRLANQIAAGEVVQRPASVAKELIENALDAGANSVEVLLKDAGSTLVQVIDDGCGMSPEDAERCFERHATSKVRSVDDLERIRTLGFRGEALASIAAVAQVTLKTKRVEDEAGTLVRVEGGKQVEKRPCAIPDGTSVAVRNLFYNVPARRNFLKTPATELKHLTQTVQSLALANPDTAFRLEHDGHEHYDLPAASDGDWHAATR